MSQTRVEYLVETKAKDIAGTGIVWLPKQGLSRELRFLCAVSSAGQTSGSVRNYSSTVEECLTGVVAAIFIVHDQLSVSLDRLIKVQPITLGPDPISIPVLTSPMSTVCLSTSQPSMLSAPINGDTGSSRRASCASSLSASPCSSGYCAVPDADFTYNRRIALYSDNTLILWLTEPQSSTFSVPSDIDKRSVTSATAAAGTPIPAPCTTSGTDGSNEIARSILAFFQLNPTSDATESNTTTTSTAPRYISVRLLTYTNRLGPINSLVLVPLRPLHISSISTRLSPFKPADLVGHRVGNGGLGLEIWVQRSLPGRLRDSTPTLVLLSTRPLCGEFFSFLCTSIGLFWSCGPKIAVKQSIG
ncbi:unnamed protein product [Echinostoma caproni]|uniref:Uncharacterized protein n=1 Tax=Echinostoma caproni TaxID=27848 RepID=A0A183B523_9TREM|nr:unnamed protein product [Echinostoma caproni]